MNFKEEALPYINSKMSPIPLVKGEKRPPKNFNQWQKYCSTVPTEEEVNLWSEKFGDCNLGLCLGSRSSSGLQLICVDIDENSTVEPVEKILGFSTPAKIGAKGKTIFALASVNICNTKIKMQGNRINKPSVEILCHGSQTVIPPSLHPSGAEYKWVGPDLMTAKKDLQIFDDGMLDEIRAYCEGKYKHFEELNTMMWAGIDGGGNTHDVCVSAVAHLVARGWDDLCIHRRIERAKSEACERGGDVYQWDESSKVIQGWIDSAREKGMTNKAKGRSKIPPEREMASWGLEELGGVDYVVNLSGNLRSYKEGHFAEVDLSELKRKMYNIDESLQLRHVENAVKILHTLTTRKGFTQTSGLEAKDDPKRQRICLLNGTFNLKTGKLEPHSPDHELCYQLKFEWDEDAKCPTYDRVIKTTFNGCKDSEDLWDEFCALTLIDDMSFQKMLFLKGPGGNGKGTLANVLRAMHDPSAIGSVAITDLNDERKRTSLVGKLVNISGEQSRLNLVSDTYLKKITGQDPIDVRMLYGETENNVKLSVRFLELVNEMPATSDSSHALRRRIIILNCPVKVENPDPYLQEKLLKERCGILKRWASALSRLYDRGGFLEPESSTLAVDDYLTENDQVAYWIKECCVEDEEGQPTKDLYCHFREWTKEIGKNPYDLNYWGRKMGQLGYDSKPKRIANQVVRIRGIKVRKGLA